MKFKKHSSRPTPLGKAITIGSIVAAGRYFLRNLLPALGVSMVLMSIGPQAQADTLRTGVSAAYGVVGQRMCGNRCGKAMRKIGGKVIDLDRAYVKKAQEFGKKLRRKN